MAIKDEAKRGFLLATPPAPEDNHLEFGLTQDGAIFIRIDNAERLIVCGPEDARYIAITLIELAHDVEAGHIAVPIVSPEPKGEN